MGSVSRRSSATWCAVLGATNPVWVDGDGDGKFTSARGYAQQVIEQNGGDEKKVNAALRRYDATVIVQAAALLKGGR